MSQLESFSATAYLIADPTRAAMLTTLLDGRALPAGELAYASGITAQTASAHLAKLLDGGLVSVETEGRHRYYRLAGTHVAQALEYLAAIRPAESGKRKALSPQGRELQFCRSCYDHLAGQVGVAITRSLQERDYIRAENDKRYSITLAGITWFNSIGIDVAKLKPTRHGLARQCLDWTERTHHIAGPLGTRLLSFLCESGWIKRKEESRCVFITPKGWVELKRHLDLDKDSVKLK